MKKLITYITILLLAAFTKTASSQIATIQTTDGSYGTTQIDVNLEGFTSSNAIGSITMNIGFNPNVATFTGITYSGIPSGFIYNVVGNEIKLSWNSIPPNPATSVNGLGFKLNFIYAGGNCNLTFNQGCEISDALGNVIQTTYIDGAINQPNLSTTASIGTVSGDYNNITEVPIVFSNFPTSPSSALVGALTLQFSYDPTKIQFVGTNTPGVLANATSGIINVSWANTTPIDLNSANFKLLFNYLGGLSDISFTGINTISNSNGVTIPVSYYNGGVVQLLTSASVDIGNATGTLSGITTVPVSFTGFPVDQGAVSLNIAYDNSALNFIGVSGLTGLYANANNGVINLSWNNTNGFNISGFNLLFSYIGGSSSLDFIGQNEITNIYGNTIPVTFTGGNVNQAATPVTVSLQDVALIPGNPTILMPINLSGITGNVNATTMYINYDITKLTYIGTQNPQKSGILAHEDINTHTVIISWSDVNPLNTLVDGKFIDLIFTFNGGIGNYNVPVNFATYNSNASSLSDDIGDPVLANWVNGVVNIASFKVSGIVEYNSDPNPRIPLVGFTVNIKSGLTIVGTTLTDANGYYEFWVSNGSYDIEVIAPYDAQHYCDFDDVMAVYYWSYDVPFAYQNALRERACDVNEDSMVDFTDVMAIYYKSFGVTTSDFTLPDFIFEQPSITVSSANYLQDILGICSGNVLGTNLTPNP